MSAQGVAVITGATGVIGSTIARRLLAHDMKVVAVARHAKGAQIERLFGEGATANVVLCDADVSDAEQVRELMAYTAGAFGRLDVLLNAAGTYGAIGSVLEVAPGTWKAAFDTNLMGCYSCCHFALPYMVAAKRGRIINVAGGGSTGPLDHFSCYAASKAALARFTDTLASEVKEMGIVANAILPGSVDSGMQDQLLAAGARAGAWYPKMKRMRETGEGFAAASLTADLVEFLLFGAGRVLSGKLLSARYDGFASWQAAEIEAIAATELFALRRMDLVTLKPIVSLEPGIGRFEKK
ncbi:MAG TPA: SDR family oxidoreductase [Burkholderiales bacterium]|nr:SDR family oxidoreductase [Burkholderiales bacterium]